MLGLYLMDFLAIVNVFHCGFGSGVSSTQNNQYAAIFTYHFTRFIFVSLQLFLLQVLAGTKVRRSGYYQFAVKLLCVHIIVTNITIWLTKFSQETGLFSSNILSGEYDSLNCTLSINDTFFLIASRMDHILEPFLLQFTLLTVGLFYTLYPLLKDSRVISKSTLTPTSAYGYKYKAVNITKDATKSYRSMPSLILGSLFAMLLVVSSWNLKNADDLIHNLRFCYIVQILIFLWTLVLSRWTLHQMKTYHRTEQHDQSYKVEDILLILSGPLGFLPFSLLVLFASFAGKKKLETFSMDNETEIRVWSALWAVVSVISVFVQTHFLVVGRNFKRDIVEEPKRRLSGEVADDMPYVRRVYSTSKIGQYLIILLFCNFGFWFTESFFEVETTVQINSQYSRLGIVEEFSPFLVAKQYWSDSAWNIIKKLLYPFLIFYRLHCVAIIAIIWRKFQVTEGVQ